MTRDFDMNILTRYAAMLRSMTAAAPIGEAATELVHHRPVHAALLETNPEQTKPIVPPFRAADGQVIAAGALRQCRLNDGPLLSALIAAQRPSGEFLRLESGDNPEPHWYYELILLHAVGLYFARTQDAAARSAIERSARFHQAETQPDHATTEPWAIFPMLLQTDTLPLADQMIHAVQIQHPNGPGRIAWTLLRDTLYCIEQTARI